MSAGGDMDAYVSNDAGFSGSSVSEVDLSRRMFLAWLGIGLASLALPVPLWAMDDGRRTYQETITVLSGLYRGEVESHLRYKAYEARALQEGHANIAHLFAATADSEAIHAQRFSEILARLGVVVVPAEQLAGELAFHVGSTKENLRQATEVELAEIDVRYPQYLARMRAEGVEGALKAVAYAWRSEQQHRELIKDIQSGTGIFFGMLVERFRTTPVRYFVCQHCGSTLTAMPVERCPVCGFSIEWYKEIPLPAG
ncbi:rubrerythrin family protein [Mariprofundus erugo]|nr:rubrerythrin family protein [Mariprofundus erugo]